MGSSICKSNSVDSTVIWRYIVCLLMLYPVNNSRGLLLHYLIIDPDCPVISENVTVPHYPQVGDVRLNSPDEIKLVSSVDADKCCCCHPMCKVGGRNSRWTVNHSIQQTVSFLNILCNTSYLTNGGCYYIMMWFSIVSLFVYTNFTDWSQTLFSHIKGFSPREWSNDEQC